MNETERKSTLAAFDKIIAKLADDCEDATLLGKFKELSRKLICDSKHHPVLRDYRLPNGRVLTCDKAIESTALAKLTHAERMELDAMFPHARVASNYERYQHKIQNAWRAKND